MSIFSFDQNGDNRIDFDELADDSVDATEAWKPKRSRRWGEVAMDLTENVDWSMLSYTIRNLNRPSPFGAEKTLLSRIDQDDDEPINANEAKQLMLVSPDVRLRVAYGTGGDGSIEIESLSRRIESLVHTVRTRGQVEILGTSFRLFAKVLPSLTQTNVFPDQAFVMLDVNRDGVLDQNELPEPALRDYSFEELDSDDDGKLTIEEIRFGLAGKEPMWSAQVRARGAETPEAIFAWLDQNQDQFLSQREIIDSADLLRSLSKHDGTVTPNDIHDTYVIQFGRGDPSQDTQLFGALIPSPSKLDPRPRWAESIDINRDGDISVEEFTGTLEQFRALDVNGDEFIDSREVNLLSDRVE